MNQPNQVPRRLPDKRKVTTYKFPQGFPIFWGPNQRILEDNKYVEPTGWTFNELLQVPHVVRFIHDAHEEQINVDPLVCHLCRFEEWYFIGRVAEVEYSAGNPGDFWPGSPIVYGPPPQVWDQLVPIVNGGVEVYKVPIIIPWSVGHARIYARNYKYYWCNQHNTEFYLTEYIDDGQPVNYYPADVPFNGFPLCPRDYPPVCPCQP